MADVCVRERGELIQDQAQAVSPQGQYTQIPSSRPHAAPSALISAQKECVHYIEMQSVLLQPTVTPHCHVKQDTVVLSDWHAQSAD